MSGSSELGGGGIVLYARVASGEPGSTEGVEEQFAALRGHAEREGHEVAGEASDVGRSGPALDRPALRRVRETVAAGGARAVMAADRPRFARDATAILLLKDEFAEAGCELRVLGGGRGLDARRSR